jgi:hypothetical protein
MGEELADVCWACACPSGDSWSGQEWDLGLANASLLLSDNILCLIW